MKDASWLTQEEVSFMSILEYNYHAIWKGSVAPLTNPD